MNDSTEATSCPSCKKAAPLCLCADVRPVATAMHVLILQHPQEPDKLLGTARLTHSILENSTLRVGLSWPNLAKALGREPGSVSPSRWGVLYLGPKGDRMGGAPGQKIRARIRAKGSKEFVPYLAGRSPALEGLVVLDGTWSQAKALWWRNAWLLKLNRVALDPAARSLYGALRKEPRRDALSTIEAVAEALEALAPDATAAAGAARAGEALRSSFGELLRRYKSAAPRAR